MAPIRVDSPLPPPFRDGVIALGNFDGVHRGHQAVIGGAFDRARREGRPALVATFDPHPARLFRPDAPPFLLTTIAQRAALFAALGADATLVIPFDPALAALPPDAFADQWLVGRLGAAGVVTGRDFSFGRGGAGKADTLAALAAARGIAADAVDPVADGDAAVSSSRIRAALRDGDPAEAARLLTRPFAVRGIVQHGDKRGRTLGYPTANLSMGDYLRPAYGVYAVRVRLPDGRVLPGAANLGIRPQFDAKELLEVFLFDFAGDLYGQPLEVALVARLRPEARFDTLEALVAQMDADCVAARALLASAPALG